jgi:predicted house-cleaning noncanonical NTP pyrophosphatase (MazG superfamily)
MAVKQYNKLVRDNIPSIIESNGKKAIYDILSPKKYIEMLDLKLTEELAEYQESKELEELADIMEVIYAITVAKGHSIEDLEALRIKKAEQRGAFVKKILLKEVIEV